MASSFRVSKINTKPRSPGKALEERVATQPDSPTHELYGARVGKILETIKSGRPCTVHGLAVEFNLSESHLQHLFKQKTGLRLGRLLTEQRLQTAAGLLKGSQMRIKQIASTVGYEHTSSFSRAFERRFAESPWAYRKLNNPVTQK
jgi:transcriptional regulator GlxA family with amidase domain